MDHAIFSPSPVSLVDQAREDKIIRKSALIRQKYGSIAKFLDVIAVSDSEPKKARRQGNAKKAG